MLLPTTVKSHSRCCCLANTRQHRHAHAFLCICSAAEWSGRQGGRRRSCAVPPVGCVWACHCGQRLAGGDDGRHLAQPVRSPGNMCSSLARTSAQ